MYGITDVNQFDSPFGKLFLNKISADKANPINCINEKSAPMLLMHGTADNVVSPAQTDLLFQTLKAHGVDAERYIVPDANHADDYWQQQEVFDLITDIAKWFKIGRLAQG